MRDVHISIVADGVKDGVGGVAVAVGGTDVAVGGTDVAVGGTDVAVGGTDVAVGGIGVADRGTDVAVEGRGVANGNSVSVGPSTCVSCSGVSRLPVTRVSWGTGLAKPGGTFLKNGLKKKTTTTMTPATTTSASMIPTRSFHRPRKSSNLPKR